MLTPVKHHHSNTQNSFLLQAMTFGVKNRLKFHHLRTDDMIDATKVNPFNFIPCIDCISNIKSRFIHIVATILVQQMPWLQEVAEITHEAIPHRFSKEMGSRSEVVSNNYSHSSHFSIVNFGSYKTRQIWGIWKLRPAYSWETPNLGQNQWCFVPCDLKIWWITLQKNRASLLCCFKLCATFYSHRWIQTGVTVRKRPIWVKFHNF